MIVSGEILKGKVGKPPISMVLPNVLLVVYDLLQLKRLEHGIINIIYIYINVYMDNSDNIFLSWDLQLSIMVRICDTEIASQQKCVCNKGGWIIY